MRAIASDLFAPAESMSSLAAAVGGTNAFGSAYFPARKRLAIRANVVARIRGIHPRRLLVGHSRG